MVERLFEAQEKADRYRLKPLQLYENFPYSISARLFSHVFIRTEALSNKYLET